LVIIKEEINMKKFGTVLKWLLILRVLAAVGIFGFKKYTDYKKEKRLSSSAA